MIQNLATCCFGSKFYLRHSSVFGKLNDILFRYNSSDCSLPIMEATPAANNLAATKRDHEQVDDGGESEQPVKVPKITVERLAKVLKNGKGRPASQAIVNKLTEEDMELLEGVRTSCNDIERIQAAIRLRKKYCLTIRLPDDYNDSDYYIENGLRKVYPYPYIYQTHAKNRWVGRRLREVLKLEFRDITDEQLKLRFDVRGIIVNGEPVNYDYILRENDFIANRTHRHELPILATPIKIIHQDKDTLVIDKPPSMPIHPCGRYRHNSVINVLSKEYKFQDIKVVHRLDRLVSGVLIFAKNTHRAHHLEEMIKNRNVQKEYVCRVEGEFPDGDPGQDGYITVDQPLYLVEGKIGIMVVHPEGKQSLTKFKKLNFNGKTSAVLCKPLSGRMHQIRVHLQFLGHPIINDGLYNSDCFGPEKGKGAKFGKTLRQLSHDVISSHRASTWLIAEDNDLVDQSEEQQVPVEKEVEEKSNGFPSQEKREETMSALEHYFTNESWKELEQKFKFDPNKNQTDPTCRDCRSHYHEPPLQKMFLYLHALRYTGAGWCYESELPIWARDTWKH